MHRAPTPLPNCAQGTHTSRLTVFRTRDVRKGQPGSPHALQKSQREPFPGRCRARPLGLLGELFGQSWGPPKSARCAFPAAAFRDRHGGLPARLGNSHAACRGGSPLGATPPLAGWRAGRGSFGDARPGDLRAPASRGAGGGGADGRGRWRRWGSPWGSFHRRRSGGARGRAARGPASGRARRRPRRRWPPRRPSPASSASSRAAALGCPGARRGWRGAALRPGAGLAERLAWPAAAPRGPAGRAPAARLRRPAPALTGGPAERLPQGGACAHVGPGGARAALRARAAAQASRGTHRRAPASALPAAPPPRPQRRPLRAQAPRLAPAPENAPALRGPRARTAGIAARCFSEAAQPVLGAAVNRLRSSRGPPAACPARHPPDHFGRGRQSPSRSPRLPYASERAAPRTAPRIFPVDSPGSSLVAF